MQSLYPVEKAIRPGCPLSIGGQGQELRYVSDLYMPAHSVLADAIFPRYTAIRALPSRQQLLDSKALLVRANGTDPTQLLLLIHAGCFSGLGYFAALARASRLASRASRNWFLRRLLISTSKPSRSPTMRPCVYSPGRAPSPTPRIRGHGISYARVLPPCLANRCLRAVLSSP